MIERILYGSKKDRLKQNVSDDQPGIYDDYFKEAVAEKEAAVKNTKCHSSEHRTPIYI